MKILTEKNAKVLCSSEDFMPRRQGDYTNIKSPWLGDQIVAAFDHEGHLLKECFFISRFDSVRANTYTRSMGSALKAEYLDEVFLAHTNQWSGNFQHFITELLPKLMNYRKNILGMKLICSPLSGNKFFFDICSLLDIPKDFIVVSEFETCYNVKSLSFCGYEENMACTEYTLNALKSFNQICKDRSSKESGTTRAYISRNNDVQDIQNNNNQTGNQRFAKNEKEFTDKISTVGFNTVYMANKSIKEKISILSNVETLLIPDGASSMNILFARNLKNVIILDTGVPDGHFSFTKSLVEHVFPKCKVEYIKSDRPTGGHSPFYINIAEVYKRICGK